MPRTATQAHASKASDKVGFMEEGSQQSGCSDWMTKLRIEIRFQRERSLTLRGMGWVEGWRRHKPLDFCDDRARPPDSKVATDEDW